MTMIKVPLNQKKRSPILCLYLVVDPKGTFG